MQPETIHIILTIVQTILIPLAVWAFHAFKASIINDLKAHVDKTMAAHESGESAKFTELGSRISRIETVLMTRGLPPAASGRRAGKGRSANV